MRTGLTVLSMIAVLSPELAKPIQVRAQDEPNVRILASMVEVRDAPSDDAVVVGRLARGARIAVIGQEGDWLSIEPPPGAFCWIDDRVLQESGDGTGVVLDDGTVIRSGIIGSRVPGPPRLSLRRGVRVRILDRPPLTVGEGRSRRDWRAIEPPDGMTYYISATGASVPSTGLIGASGPSSSSIRSIANTNAASRVRTISIDRELVGLGVTQSAANLPPSLEASLRTIETEHKSQLQRPLEAWHLDGVLARYQALLEATGDLSGQAFLRSRIAHVRRQQEAADAARRVRSLLLQGQGRDFQSVPSQPGTGSATWKSEVEHDAIGLLQRSNRIVGGVRVYALIGRDGSAIAYLKMPPGINTERLLAREVGVRGEVGYDGDLRARVIDVRELEVLSQAP